VQACDDTALLGFPLWPGQRRLLEALEEALTAGDWLNVWCIGRRSGKSTLAALVALHSCLLRPDLDASAPMGSHGIVVATNLKQARMVVSTAAEIVQRSPLLARLVDKVALDEIRFTNGTTLASFPASSRGGRGRAVRCLVLDEAAHLADNDTGAAHEAEELYRALIPATAQFSGLTPVIVSSTPAGDSNWFASLVTAGRAGQLEHGRAYVAASADMNPTLDADFLASEERRDPDGFRGEYLAELIGSGGAFLDPELIETCVASRGELDPGDADAWVAGFDPSFAKDPAALVIVGRSRENRDRLLVGAVRTWQPPKGRKRPEGADRRALEDKLLSEVCEVCERYGVRTVATDGYMAGVVHEALRRRGLWVEAHTLTTASKVELFSNLKARLTAGSIELPDDATLISELRRLRSTFRGGSRQVETPRLQGTHCDTAIGLALAVQHLDRDGRPGKGTPLVSHEQPDHDPRRAFSLPRQFTSAETVRDYAF
jgi:hypothetical protein